MPLSNWANGLCGYVPKSSFADITPEYYPTDSDIEGFIRLYIFENIPYFIMKKPLVFDKIRLDIATDIGIRDLGVQLTGSAKLGFSLNPKKWLNEYDPDKGSDVDFFTISEGLFVSLREELRIWREYLIAKGRFPRADEVKEFEKKADTRGFINTWDIPDDYPFAKKCKRATHRACLNLNLWAGEKVVSDRPKNASIRCYKNYDSAVEQLRISIKDSLKKRRLLQS